MGQGEDEQYFRFVICDLDLEESQGKTSNRVPSLHFPADQIGPMGHRGTEMERMLKRELWRIHGLF